VLFDKIATVYIIRKIYLYLSIGNGRPMEHALCGANGIGTLSLLGRETVTGLEKNLGLKKFLGFRCICF